jgi:site-specific recombinase XerD
MKQKETVKELMANCIKYFESHSYSQLRIDRYKSMWRNGIISFLDEKSIQYYDASVGEEFIGSRMTGSIITPSQRDFIRSINVLNEFQEKGKISKRLCHPIERKLTGQIGELMNKFLLHLKILRRNEKSITDHRLYLYRFLIFLESKQVRDTEDIKEEHIIIFLSTLTNNKICVVSTIHFFLKYLFEERILHSNLSFVLQHYKWTNREKLPSVYTSKEVLQIESSIRRENATGKRNYAMMLLATRLGLRASDIAHLTFDNIKWESSTIILSQFKTGREVELPLLADVGEAIIDYLKYGRKRSESQRVFLYTRAPFTEMRNSAVACLIGNLVFISGIDTTGRKHGPHAMRHSLVSRFLENRESFPVISEALGHQSTDTTMSYIRIDVESLRQCALEVPTVPITFYEQKGGVYYE